MKIRAFYLDNLRPKILKSIEDAPEGSTIFFFPRKSLYPKIVDKKDIRELTTCWKFPDLWVIKDAARIYFGDVKDLVIALHSTQKNLVAFNLQRNLLLKCTKSISKNQVGL